MSLQARAIAILVLLVAGAAGWWFLTEHYESIGYQRAKAEDAQAMAEQATRNRELQRQAEMRYVVQAETREHFIVQTVTEIRHETDNLRACALTAAARDRLRRAAACARGDSAAACSPDKPLPVTQ